MICFIGTIKISRTGVTKNLNDCGESDYIGVSRRFVFCGTYDEVAVRCSGSDEGYMIINRRQLDLGFVSFIQ